MKSNLFLIAACAFMTTACSVDNSENNEPTPTPQPEKTVVKFYPTLTRATETTFENGDMIGVFAVEPSAGSSLKSRGNYADNVCYTYSETAFTAENGISLPADDSAGLAYYAVYPYSTGISDKGTFAVRTNQQTHANITASDFCTAYTPTTNSTEVQLNFSHRLSRISFDLFGEDLASKTVKITLGNICYEMSYNLNANTFVATDKKSDIQMGETSTNHFEAIVVPQTTVSGETTIVITIDGKDYTGYFEDLVFRSGKEYNYPLKITPEYNVVILQGDINPWDTEDKRLNNVVPEDIQEKLSEHMPIYSGVNPPNVEGTYYMDPFEVVYCEDNNWDPGTIVQSYYCRFMNQNYIDNTIDFEDINEFGNGSDIGTGAFISGSGNNFTAFFNTIGETYGIATRHALMISGTKTSDGIKDLYYAFVMVEKGDDTNHPLMAEGIFRVFRDQDGLSVNTTWPSSTRSIIKGDGWLAPWTKDSRAE